MKTMQQLTASYDDLEQQYNNLKNINIAMVKENQESTSKLKEVTSQKKMLKIETILT